MKDLSQDIKYAFRMLAKSPGFSVIAILTLALGIGANTAIFSVINELMLRPLPYSEPDRLFRINRTGSSYVDLQDIAERSKSYEQIAGYREQAFDLTEGADAERFPGALVTGSLFQLLGAKSSRGRLIHPSDDQPGGQRIVVITNEFWKTRLGGRADVIGSSLSFSGIPYTIVGILESGFHLPQMETDIFAPLRVESKEEAAARGAHSLVGIVRLKHGVTKEQAQSEWNLIAKDLERLDPIENNDFRLVLYSLQEHLTRKIKPALYLLLGTVVVVLLIAGSNVGGLLLARSVARSREFAVRTALGAGRGRMIRQLLVEYLLLAFAGGLLGIFLALWIADIIVQLNPQTLVRIDRIHLDGTVLLFAAAVSIITGLIFGMVPAFQASKAEPFSALKEVRSAGRPGSHRFRNVLVVSELMLAIVLLVGSGLLLRSFYNLMNVQPGFNSHDLTTMNLTLSIKNYGGIPKRTILFDQFLNRVRSLPGIQSVALTSELPFGPGGVFHNVAIEGKEQTPGTEPEIYNRSISPDYFQTMQIPLKAGRNFGDQDHAKALPVTIINEAAARTYFAGQNPIGKRVRWANDGAPDESDWISIVGVVGDVHTSLDADEVPALYTPFTQETRFWKTWMNIVVRSSLQPIAIAASLRKELASLDRNVPLTDVKGMEEWISLSVADRKFNLQLLGAFAGLALLLSSLGLYGLISFTVSERTSELGVRMALGAQRRDILNLIVKQSLRLAIVGIGLGLVVSFISARVIRGMLYGTSSMDPVTLAVVCVLLAATAIIASLGPALRAIRVDPASTLRYE
jgi:putative ABC transport system permease protein